MVRITLCTFRTASSSPNARPTEFILKCFPTTTSAKVATQNRPNLAGATPLFGSQSAQKFCPGRCRPLLHSGAHVFSPRGEAASLLAVKFSSSGEVGFTPLLHRNLTCYFTLDRARHYGNQSDESSRRTKLCAAQTVPEAGATPPFGAPCVTVAVWSLPPSQGLRGPFCAVAYADPRICQTECLTSRMKAKGEPVVYIEVTTKTAQSSHYPSACRRIGKDSA